MMLVARQMKLSAAGARVTAQAEALVAATHKICPFSNAVVGNCNVKLTVVPPSEVL